jgi:hypothetical protein
VVSHFFSNEISKNKMINIFRFSHNFWYFHLHHTILVGEWVKLFAWNFSFSLSAPLRWFYGGWKTFFFWEITEIFKERKMLKILGIIYINHWKDP